MAKLPITKIKVCGCGSVLLVKAKRLLSEKLRASFTK